MKIPKEERRGENEDEESSNSDRQKRNRNAPTYYGNPVMIYGVEKDEEAVTITYLSTDENIIAKQSIAHDT